MAAAADFNTVLRAAIEDISEQGYDDPQRIAMWMQRLKETAERSLAPEHMLRGMLDDALRAVYGRLIDRGGIYRVHPGVSRYTLMNVAPKLRAELDRRILASADLIKLNREETIAKIQRRFAGWATSVPAGGGSDTGRREAKDDVRKALKQLPFAERRVMIDQGHKLNAALSNIVATDAGAIAAQWFSHYRQPNYDYREDHKERDGVVYLVRGSWALEKGFIKASAGGYIDDHDQPAEKPFCRCRFKWLYSLRDINRDAPDMLTVPGRAEFERVRVA